MQERKNRFERVAKATGIVVWEYNIQNDRLYIDEQISTLLGKPLQSKMPSLQEWNTFIHPDDVSEVAIPRMDFLKTLDKEYEFFYRIHTDNRGYIWIRETGSVITTDRNGEPQKIVGLFEDIHEKRKEEIVLDKFYAITVDSDMPFNDKANKILTLGAQFFQLDVGFVSRITKDHYKIEYCAPNDIIPHPQMATYLNTHGVDVFGPTGIKCWHNAKTCDIPQGSKTASLSLNAYIGTNLIVNEQPYGTLAFCSTSKRGKRFSNREKMLLQLIAQWMASEMGRQDSLNEVKESQVFLQLIQDSIPDLIFVKDEAFRIVSGNPAFLNVYPESMRASVIGSTTIESYDDEEAEAFLQNDKLAFATGNSETEETIEFPDGKTRTLHTKKIRFQNQKNQNFILGIGRDITIRKQALSRLADSEERYELAVKGSSVGLWDWQIQSGGLFWSDRFKEIIGIDDSEFRPQYEEFAERLHPEDKQRVEQALQDHINGKSPYNIEYRLRKTDDTYVWIHARGQAIWDHEGQATRMAGSVDDITLQVAAQQEVLRSNQELERFAYVASHDLQEPLRMVINFTQLLEKKYGDKLDNKALEYIQFAKNGASRMKQLVQDLLDYARIGNEAENRQHIELNDIKTQILENLADSIKLTKANIEWQELPSILADQARILSVFQNLIGNAIKYRKTDHAPKIRVSVKSSGSYWEFCVADNGIGMKQAYCAKIFEPFKRLHTKEEYSGTGMGLSICRKTIEELNGKIWAMSELGQGSKFYFRLPKLNPNTRSETIL